MKCSSRGGGRWLEQGDEDGHQRGQTAHPARTSCSGASGVVPMPRASGSRPRRSAAARSERVALATSNGSGGVNGTDGGQLLVHVHVDDSTGVEDRHCRTRTDSALLQQAGDLVDGHRTIGRKHPGRTRLRGTGRADTATRSGAWCGAGVAGGECKATRPNGFLGRVLYRCDSKAEYPAVGHPESMYVAEARTLPALDRWLGDLFAPDRIEETVMAIMDEADQARPEAPELREARQTATESRKLISRHIAAIEAGVDPAVIATRMREAHVALAQAEAILAAHQDGPALSVDDLRDLLCSGEALPQLLAVATPDERRRIYDAAGISLRYSGTKNAASLLGRPYP